MPAYRVLTVVLMALVALATVQLIAPGAGYHWFGSDFIPDGWTYSERYTFLLTEAIPVLIFICVGVAFYVMGRKTRERAAAVAAARAAAGAEPLAD
jgi:hypothetical protein